MDAELQAKWERVASYLRAVLAEVDLGNADRAQVEAFLEYNELGVAFDWIVGVLVERDLAMSDDARQRVAVASTEMQLELNPDWQRLQARR